MHVSIDLVAEEHIEAPPSDVYRLVADLSRMGEWSPENTGGEWITGGPGQVGSRFVGHNRRADDVWDGVLMVTVADGSRLEWVMGGDPARPQGTWRYEFEPSGTGTRVIEHYTLGPAASGFRDALAGHADEVVAKLVSARRDELQAGMRTTLSSLKATAEGLLTTAEFSAMRGTVAALDELLTELSPADWQLPTRCDPLDVRALVVHIAGSFAFVATWLTAPVVGEARIDRSTIWRSFPVQTRDLVVDAAVSGSEGRTPEEVTAELHTAVDRFIDTAAGIPRNALAACPAFGDDFVLPAVDVVANRVLEVGVHLLDLQAAVGRPETLPECAAPFVTSILDALLGQPAPAALAWSPTRYTLVGTGRATPTGRERAALGRDLMARLPLLQ